MKVFVYGTLKAGFSNSALLDDATLVGADILAPEYTMYDLGAFPAVSIGGTTPITGEVWEVDDFTMSRLDTLEGYPHFYNRSLIPTAHGEAWLYHINDTSAYASRPMASGVWT